MQYLKQSTAADILLGPFVDSVDFVTLETALTISQADIRLSKGGAAFAQTNNAAGATHRENGHYIIPLDTTDTNTLGSLRVAVHESGALPVWRDFMVVPANVWDSLFGADKLQVDVAEWLGTAAATPTVAGVPEVDVTHVGGTAQTAGDIIADTNDIQSRLPAALDTGRIVAKAEVVTDKTGYAIGVGGIASTAFAAGAIDAAAIATDAIGSAELAAAACEKIADALLARNVAGGSNTGRLVKQALYVLRNRVAIAAGTMTVYQPDDATPEFTAAVTTTAGDPISQVDPT